MVSNAIVLVTVAAIYFACNGDNSFLQNVLGQAEETFGQNSTFLYEVEQMQRQKQTQTTSMALDSQIKDSQSATPVPLGSAQQLTNRQDINTISSLEPTGPEQTMLASGNNLYFIWETNETGNWEVMFRASNDFGETFADKINLSNSTKTDSKRAEITTSQSKVFVSWQEGTPSNITEFLTRISDDEGQTFGPILHLSRNGAISERQTMPDTSRYENSEYGLLLEYPSGWQVVNGSNPNNSSIIDVAGLVSPFERRLDNYRENLWISLDNLRGKNVTLEDYSHGLVGYKQATLDGFRLLDYNTDSNILANHPAYRLVYSRTTEDDVTIKEMEIGTKIDDKIYYLVYSAEQQMYGDLLPTIHDIIDSFDVLVKSKQ